MLMLNANVCEIDWNFTSHVRDSRIRLKIVCKKFFNQKFYCSWFFRLFFVFKLFFYGVKFFVIRIFKEIMLANASKQNFWLYYFLQCIQN